MGYKNKVFSEMAKELGKDIGKAARVSGKFMWDALRTEFVPREKKTKLKNYDPPEFYLKAARPFLKMFGGFLAGSASIVLTNSPDLTNAALKANPFYVYGLADGMYEAVEAKDNNVSLPPATLLIELPYSCFSNLRKRIQKNYST